jgi:hypothetical protein
MVLAACCLAVDEFIAALEGGRLLGGGVAPAALHCVARSRCGRQQSDRRGDESTPCDSSSQQGGAQAAAQGSLTVAPQPAASASRLPPPLQPPGGRGCGQSWPQAVQACSLAGALGLLVARNALQCDSCRSE